MAIRAGEQDESALMPGGTGPEATEVDDGRSQFDRLRDYLTGQFGAVRQVEAEQQSAELLLDLAEGELGDLKREFEAARLSASGH